MYNLFISMCRVLISIPTKELVIAAGSYLLGKCIDKKKKAVKELK